MVVAKFGHACQTCPLRSSCTTSRAGRSISIHLHESASAAARARNRDPIWRHRYRTTRPKIERKLGHLMRRDTAHATSESVVSSRSLPISTCSPPPTTSPDSPDSDSNQHPPDGRSDNPPATENRPIQPISRASTATTRPQHSPTHPPIRHGRNDPNSPRSIPTPNYRRRSRQTHPIHTSHLGERSKRQDCGSGRIAPKPDPCRALSWVADSRNLSGSSGTLKSRYAATSSTSTATNPCSPGQGFGGLVATSRMSRAGDEPVTNPLAMWNWTTPTGANMSTMKSGTGQLLALCKGRSPVEVGAFGKEKPLLSRGFIVGEGGLEPPHPFEYWHLKPARLPFRHSPEWIANVSKPERPSPTSIAAGGLPRAPKVHKIPLPFGLQWACNRLSMV